MLHSFSPFLRILKSHAAKSGRSEGVQPPGIHTLQYRLYLLCIPIPHLRRLRAALCDPVHASEKNVCAANLAAQTHCFSEIAAGDPSVGRCPDRPPMYLTYPAACPSDRPGHHSDPLAGHLTPFHLLPGSRKLSCLPVFDCVDSFSLIMYYIVSCRIWQ